MVMFSVPDDAKSDYPMVPDKDDDEATATAMVNSEMMVSVSMPAIVSPTFVPGASPIGLIPGDNSPFTYVSWNAMQTMVVSTGATFAVQAVEIGANQVAIPIGDATFVTCGPFECAMGMDAPELSIANSAMCTAWDPTVEIQVGKVDNDVLDVATDGERQSNDGVDLGIVTSSTLGMNVKHVFSGVAGGTNTSKTVEAASGSDKTLAMAAVASITVDQDADDDDTVNIDDMMVCDNTYDDGNLTDRPKGCFRLVGPGATRPDYDASKGADYLSGWSIELSPLGADVAWGDVDWEENPFEDLECGASDPIMVADHVDICEMFDAEVSLATGKGWKPEVVFDENSRVVMWRAGATAGTGTSMFKTVWFDDNLNGAILKDTKAAAQADRAMALGGTDAAASGLHDLYNQNVADDNIDKIWELLTDSNMDLTAGDLGKVDMLSDSDNPRTADDETTILLEACAAGTKWTATNAADVLAGGCGGVIAENHQVGRTATNPDGNADNYPAMLEGAATGFGDFRGCTEDDGGDDADGSECDATWENDIEILFADGTFGCSTTRAITVTCEWDADGGMTQGRNALPSAADLGTADNADNNRSNYIKCSAK